VAICVIGKVQDRIPKCRMCRHVLSIRRIAWDVKYIIAENSHSRPIQSPLQICSLLRL
jgi:hypothetical protein